MKQKQTLKKSNVESLILLYNIAVTVSPFFIGTHILSPFTLAMRLYTNVLPQKKKKKGKIITTK